MAFSPGDRIGPYEIIDAIGAGGMGEVYKARDTRLDRTVAIKTSKNQFSERFEREARAVAALNHPNICTLYDIGSNYLVMEHIEGEPLKGPLPLAKVFLYGAQICDALDLAHRRGVIHRDLKPANVIMTKSGIKLLDFGLAKFARASGAAADDTVSVAITKENTMLGTLQYMSPEQLQARDTDGRSDIFSFGCVLYEMLTGKRAFEAPDHASLISTILRDDPAPMSAAEVPPALDRVVKKCLAKDPDGRWQNAGDLADELRWVAGISAAEMPARKIRAATNSLLMGMGSSLMLGLLLGAGATHWLRGPASQEIIVPRYLTYSGRDSSPAISPDGKTVAFVSDRDGRARIWLKQLASGSEVVLSAGTDENPRFSPDGSMLLFTRADGARPSLYRMSSLGGETRKVVDDVATADFSPDGRHIVFLRWKSDPRESTVVVLVGLDGSGATELAEISGLRFEFPRWSPDGGHIAMVGNPESDFRDALLVVSADGKTKKYVIPPGSGVGLTSPAWTSNQELIYLTGDPPNAAPPTLVRQNITSGAIQSYPWPYYSSVIDVTRSGTLVFDSIPSRCSLRELLLDGKATPRAAQWQAKGNSIDREPAYSPDGKHIVFASNRSGNMDVWQMVTETGTVNRVTDHPGVDYDPAYSQDGNRVIWSSNRSGHFEIYIAEADGSGARRVTDDGRDAENPTMTSDGKWIIYASYHPDKLGIWKIHPDGSGAVRLVAGSYFNAEASPDGEYALYLSSVRTDRNVIRVVRVSDGLKLPFEIVCDIRRRSRQLIGRSRWMPDGKAIAFVGQDENGMNGIYTQPYEPGRDTISKRSKLGGFDADMVSDTLGISPDGRRMIISAWERTTSVMLAEQLPLMR
jgi:Tol biopolymer transport system component/tRNA A-37 threonylcarbamoyl transferase component Bud32